MTFFPNVREDEVYNEKMLKPPFIDRLGGYDYAVEEVETAFANLDAHIDESLIIHYLAENPEELEKLKAVILRYLEIERNEMVVSMIESQTDEGGIEANGK